MRLLEAAASIFSESGFDVSTREVAGRAGVTQALLYKHFKSKSSLVAAVLDHVFADRFRGDWAVLADASDKRSFEDRLVDGYTRFARTSDGQRMRLFVRAGLDGWSQALRRGGALTTLIFEPVIAELRKCVGLSDLAARPMLRGERELAMMLHGAVVFLSIRKHVYGMAMADDQSDVVELYVRTFFNGALVTLKQVHAAEAARGLTVTQLRPKRL